jgi:hypothetical protein
MDNHVPCFHGIVKKLIQNIGFRTARKGPLGRPKPRRQNYIKGIFLGTECENVSSIHLA